MSADLRTVSMYQLQRDKASPKWGIFHLMKRLKFLNSEEKKVPLHCHNQHLFCSRMIVTVILQSMDQITLLKYYYWFNPRSSHTKDSKMLLDAPWLNTLHYKVRVKWNNPGNGIAPFPTPQCSRYWKGSLRVTLD